MAIRKHSIVNDSADIDMVPIVDVVFLLVVFLLIAGYFIKDAASKSYSDEEIAALKQDATTISVIVTGTDQVWVGAHQIDPRILRKTLERLRAVTPKAAVVVEMDRGVRKVLQATIVDAVRDAGIRDYVLVEQGAS